MSGALLAIKDVSRTTSLSRTSVWRLSKAGDFPKPVQISPGRVAWVESEVDEWKTARVARSRRQR